MTRSARGLGRGLKVELRPGAYGDACDGDAASANWHSCGNLLVAARSKSTAFDDYRSLRNSVGGSSCSDMLASFAV